MWDTEYHMPNFGVCFMLTIEGGVGSQRQIICFPLIFSQFDELTELIDVVWLWLSGSNQQGEGIMPVQVSYHQHILMLAPSSNRVWHHGVWEMGMHEP